MQAKIINIATDWGWWPSHTEYDALKLLTQCLESNFLSSDKITPDRTRRPHPLVFKSIPESFRFPIHALMSQQPPMGIVGLSSMSYGRGATQFVIVGWEPFEQEMEAFLLRHRRTLKSLQPTPKQLQQQALAQYRRLLQEKALKNGNVTIEHVLAVPRDLQMIFGTYALFTTARLTPPGEPLGQNLTLHIGFSPRNDMMQAALDFGIVEGTMNLAFSPLVLSSYAHMTSNQLHQHTSRVPRHASENCLKRKARCAFSRGNHQDEKPIKSTTPGPASNAKDSPIDVGMSGLTLHPRRRVHVTCRACCAETGRVDGKTRTGHLDFDETFTKFDGCIEFPGGGEEYEEIWLPLQGFKISSFPEKIPKMWETYGPAAEVRQSQMLETVRAWRSLVTSSSPEMLED
ncbi:hypothetical protein QBC43DRAFT_353804 [Cladorrhinum sp. PSN259]|nr:hypothetical protein QBC43DRAFT_353804 [Cladorrhinum sp. PSN259]